MKYSGSLTENRNRLAALAMHPMLTLGLLASAVLLITASAATASGESERQYSLGLVDFNAARYEAAIDHFDRVSAEDSASVFALYYRAVSNSRLDNYESAIADLRKVLDQRPDLHQANLELGYALFSTNQFKEAAQWLKKAQQYPETEAEASLFLGIAQVRNGDYKRASENLRRASERDPEFELSARYYIGVAAFQARNYSEAAEQFDLVVSNSPGSEMAEQAEAYLSAMADAVPKRLQVYGAAGFQYDSNVLLAPDSESLKSDIGISNEADGRAILSTGLNYTPVVNDQFQLSGGYEFFQSLHFNLTEFNLQGHRANAFMSGLAGRIRYNLWARYDFYLRDSETFLGETNVLPWLEIPEDRFGRTELHYRIRHRNFFEDAFSALDGLNNATGIRQFFYLGSPRRYLSLGYRFDRENPDDKRFAYDGNRAETGVGWDLPYQITANAQFSYRHQNYFDSASDGREDNEYQFVAALTRPLNKHLWMRASFFGEINNSNQPLFEYNRYVGSLVLEGRY